MAAITISKLDAGRRLLETAITWFNLAFSWSRIANQTDGYVAFLKNLRSEK
jgi:hypothetical protein